MKFTCFALLPAAFALLTFAFSSCSHSSSSDSNALVTEPVPQTAPDEKMPNYIDTYSWGRITDAKFDSIWTTYNLDVQLYTRAVLYQKDHNKDLDMKVYWDCPVERSGDTFVLNTGTGHNVRLELTRREYDYTAVFQAKEDASMIRFYTKFDNGDVYEAVHRNGWLVHVREETTTTSYDEVIDYYNPGN